VCLACDTLSTVGRPTPHTPPPNALGAITQAAHCSPTPAPTNLHTAMTGDFPALMRNG
jgi:hypothetical protein